jgi:hypothetical protein
VQGGDNMPAAFHSARQVLWRRSGCLLQGLLAPNCSCAIIAHECGLLSEYKKQTKVHEEKKTALFI